MSMLSEFVPEVLTFDFMQQAYAIGLVVAVPLSVLSCFLVLRGWALLGDAIAHAVLPGIVLASVLAIPIGIGAFFAGLACALLTGYLNETSRVKEDTIIGVVFSTLFALGIVLYVAIETDLHLDRILFGDMLGLDWKVVIRSAVIALFITGATAALSKDFLLTLFDRQHARAVGLPVRWLTYGLLALLTLAVVAALNAVGILLSISLLIAPGAIAFLLTNRFFRMVQLAIAVSCIAAVAGITMSFYLNSAPAPTIVVVLTAIFITVFVGRSVVIARQARPL